MGDGTCYICAHEDRPARVACRCRDMPICNKCLHRAIRSIPTYRDGICPQCKTPFKGYDPSVAIDVTLLVFVALLPLLPPFVFIILAFGRGYLVGYAAVMLLLATVTMCRRDETLPETFVLLRLRPRLVVSFAL